MKTSILLLMWHHQHQNREPQNPLNTTRTHSSKSCSTEVVALHGELSKIPNSTAMEKIYVHWRMPATKLFVPVLNHIIRFDVCSHSAVLVRGETSEKCDAAKMDHVRLRSWSLTLLTRFVGLCSANENTSKQSTSHPHPSASLLMSSAV